MPHTIQPALGLHKMRKQISTDMSDSLESQSIASAFRAKFNAEAQVIARAPGRIEFIGNHTDYNGGAVIGAAIDRYVYAAAAINLHGRIRLFSTATNTVFEIPNQFETRIVGADAWANYPLGVWQALRDFNLPRPDGFDLYLHADLPAGAGLSSSAAVELATALALLRLADAPQVDAPTLALIGRHAENRYVGMPCGILDQGTSAHGRSNSLVHINCLTTSYSRLPLPAQTQFWVFNTCEKHALVDGMYAMRRAECEEAARLLGVDWLTQVTTEEFARKGRQLPPTLAKRARHVIEENARVDGVCQALMRGDVSTVGRRLVDSHRSSQHLFENSTPALDSLVHALERASGVYGARLTGGGFGGAVVAFCSAEFVLNEANRIATMHARNFGRAPEVLHLRVADGARLIAASN